MKMRSAWRSLLSSIAFGWFTNRRRRRAERAKRRRLVRSHRVDRLEDRCLMDASPVGSDDHVGVDVNGTVMIGQASLLANDTDSDPGSTLGVSSWDATTHQGVAVSFVSGAFSYEAPEDFSGTDYFDYVVSDGVHTDTARVFIHAGKMFEGSSATNYDRLGISMSADGNWLAVGASTATVSGTAGGKVEVYHLSGGSWTLHSTIAPPFNEGSGQFGDAVSIDQFGPGADDVRVIVGARYIDRPSSIADPQYVDAGAAYIFKKDGSTWDLEATLASPNRADGDYFGESVDIDGNFAVVGEWADGSWTGKAYVFELTGSVWGSAIEITKPSGTGKLFGYTVSVSGSTLAITEDAQDHGTPGVNNVYLYDKIGGTWTHAATVGSLIPSQDRTTGDALGEVISLRGDWLAVSARKDDSGATDSGSVYVLHRTSGTWSLAQKITSPDAQAGAHFGYSVAIDDDGGLVVGAVNQDGTNTDQGAVYAYKLVDGVWTLRQKVMHPAFVGTQTGNNPDRLGYSVALSGDWIMTGAEGHNVGSGTYGKDGGGLWIMGWDRSEPNTAPTITALANQAIDEDEETEELEFTVGDAETAAGSLDVTASSSNATLFPEGSIEIEGTGANWTIKLTPEEHQYGTATITVTVSDGVLQAEETFTVTVRAVNDAPVATITPTSYSATEQTPVALHGTGLSVADVDAGSSTVTAVVSVTSGKLTVAAGTTGVTVSGSGTGGVLLSGTVAQINALLAGSLSGSLTYEADTDAPAASATLTLLVSDLGNTGSGGTRTDSDTAVINLTAVNDAPVNTVPGSQVVAQDGELVFSNAGGNRISVTDADLGTGLLQVTLTATNGTVTLSGTSGLTFIAGDGTADSVMTFRGTRVHLNAALDGLKFKPTAGHAGTAGLEIATDDLGNTGTGGALTDIDTVAITVDATPTISAIENQTVAEDGTLGPIEFTIGDADTGADDLTVTAETSDGTLIPLGNIEFGGEGANRTVTIAPVDNVNGGPVTIAIRVSDGLSTSQTTFTVTIDAVNDPPSFTVIAAGAGGNVGVVNDSGDYFEPWATGISAAPGETGNLSWEVTIDPLSSTPDLFAVAPSIDAEGHLSFRPADGKTGTAQVTVRLVDSDAGTIEYSAPVTFTISVEQPTITATVTGQSRLEGDEEITFTVSLSWLPVGPVSVDWSLAIGTATMPADFGHEWLPPWTEPVQVPGYNVTVHEPYTLYWNKEYQVQVGEESGYWVYSRFEYEEGPVVYETFFSVGGTVDPLWINYGGGTRPIMETVGAGSLPPSEMGPDPTWINGADTTSEVRVIDAFRHDGEAVWNWPTSWAPAWGGQYYYYYTWEYAERTDYIQHPGEWVPAHPLSGTLEFAAGETEKTITVYVHDDDAEEANETITLNLANPQGISLLTGEQSALGTILNDERYPPTMPPFADQEMLEDGTKVVIFEAAGHDYLGEELEFTATSSDTDLFPPGSLTFGTQGADYKLTLKPADNLSGTAVITVTLTQAAPGVGTYTITRTFEIEVLAVNDVPTISPIADPDAIAEDGVVGPLSFTIGDWETAATSLEVTASSNNTTLFPEGSIAFMGSDERMILLTPAENQYGTATITVTVSDGVSEVQETFTVTVDPVDDAPTISAIAPQTISEDGSTGGLTFTIGDAETDADDLTVTAETSDGTLIPLSRIELGGTGATRTVTVSPAENRNGGPVTITVRVSDGTNTSETTFTVTVEAVNDPPSFNVVAGGGGVEVLNDSGNYSAEWATNISAGLGETDGLEWIITTDNDGLFATGPAIDGSGRLTFRPADHTVGSAVVTVKLVEDRYGTPRYSSESTFTISVVTPPTITISGQTQPRYEQNGTITFKVNLSWAALGTVSVDWALANGTGASAATMPSDFGYEWEAPWTEEVPVPGYDVTVHQPYTLYWNKEYEVQVGEESGYWVSSRYEYEEGPVNNETFFSVGATVDPLWISYTSGTRPIMETIEAGSLPPSETGPDPAWLNGADTTSEERIIAAFHVDGEYDPSWPTTPVYLSQYGVTGYYTWQAAERTEYIEHAGEWVPAHALSGTLEFAAGETEKTVTVHLHNDDIEEANETFFLELSNAQGADLPTSNARIVGTILNDERYSPTMPPIADQEMVEDGTKVVTFEAASHDYLGGALQFTATSSDPLLFPEGSLTFGTQGANFTLTLEPAENRYGTATITVTLTQSAPGVGTYATSRSFDIEVAAVNDPPGIVGPTAVIVPPGTDQVFSTATENAVWIVDDATGDIEVTISVSDGTFSLNAAAIAGLTLTVGTGSEDATLTMLGTVAEVNAALDGLTFHAAADGGEIELVIAVDDLGSGAGGALSASHTIEIAAHSPPIGVADSYTVTEDGVLEKTTETGVLANDLNGVGDRTTTITVAPQHGLLTLRLDGSFKYYPDPDYFGPDAFSYRVTDALGDSSASTTVTITVTSVNDAPVISGPTSAATKIDGPITFGTINNNRITFADDGTGELTVTVTVGHGVLKLATTTGLEFEGSTTNDSASFEVTGTAAELNAAFENLSYSPGSGYDGADTLVVDVTDALGAESTRSIALDVAPRLTVADVNTQEGTATVTIVVTLGATNRSGSFKWTLVDGSAVRGAGNDYTAAIYSYTETFGPSASVQTFPITISIPEDSVREGIESLVLVLSDVEGAFVERSRAVVWIADTTENTPPEATALPQTFVTDEDRALVVGAADGVLKGASDADGDRLTAVLVSGPAHGTLRLHADGSFEYTPGANMHDDVSFAYRVFDGEDESADKTVSITINPVADTPVAARDVYTVGMNETLSVALAEKVTRNDVNPDGVALTVALVEGTKNGSLTFNTDGTFTYRPNANFAGADRFTYEISSVNGKSTAEVIIEVGDLMMGTRAYVLAPNYSDPYYTYTDFGLNLTRDTIYGARFEGLQLVGSSLPGNFSNLLVIDANGFSNSSYLNESLFAVPAGGTEPARPYGLRAMILPEMGPYTLKFQAVKWNAVTETTENVGNAFEVLVDFGDAPRFKDGEGNWIYEQTETPKGVDLAGLEIVANFREWPADPITQVRVTGIEHGELFRLDGMTEIPIVEGAILDVADAAGLIFRPETDFVGISSVTVRALDAASDEIGQATTLTIVVTDTAPTQAVPRRYDDALEGTTLVVGSADGVLSGINGASNAYLVQNAVHGIVVLNSLDGSFTYTPTDANFFGSDTFTYRVTVNSVDSYAVATIHVTNVNDAPSFEPGDDLIVAADVGEVELEDWATNLKTGPINEAEQTLTFEIVSNSNTGLFSAGPAISADGKLTFTLVENASPGKATIEVRVRDSGGTAHGGVDVSDTFTFTIDVVEPAAPGGPPRGPGGLPNQPVGIETPSYGAKITVPGEQLVKQYVPSAIEGIKIEGDFPEGTKLRAKVSVSTGRIRTESHGGRDSLTLVGDIETLEEAFEDLKYRSSHYGFDVMKIEVVALKVPYGVRLPGMVATVPIEIAPYPYPSVSHGVVLDPAWEGEGAKGWIRGQLTVDAPKDALGDDAYKGLKVRIEIEGRAAETRDIDADGNFELRFDYDDDDPSGTFGDDLKYTIELEGFEPPPTDDLFGDDEPPEYEPFSDGGTLHLVNLFPKVTESSRADAEAAWADGKTASEVAAYLQFTDSDTDDGALQRTVTWEGDPNTPRRFRVTVTVEDDDLGETSVMIAGFNEQEELHPYNDTPDIVSENERTDPEDDSLAWEGGEGEMDLEVNLDAQSPSPVDLQSYVENGIYRYTQWDQTYKVWLDRRSVLYDWNEEPRPSWWDPFEVYGDGRIGILVQEKAVYYGNATKIVPKRELFASVPMEFDPVDHPAYSVDAAGVLTIKYDAIASGEATLPESVSLTYNAVAGGVWTQDDDQVTSDDIPDDMTLVVRFNLTDVTLSATGRVLDGLAVETGTNSALADSFRQAVVRFERDVKYYGDPNATQASITEASREIEIKYRLVNTDDDSPATDLEPENTTGASGGIYKATIGQDRDYVDVVLLAKNDSVDGERDRLVKVVIVSVNGKKVGTNQPVDNEATEPGEDVPGQIRVVDKQEFFNLSSNNVDTASTGLAREEVQVGAKQVDLFDGRESWQVPFLEEYLPEIQNGYASQGVIRYRQEGEENAWRIAKNQNGDTHVAIQGTDHGTLLRDELGVADAYLAWNPNPTVAGSSIFGFFGYVDVLTPAARVQRLEDGATANGFMLYRRDGTSAWFEAEPAGTSTDIDEGTLKTPTSGTLRTYEYQFTGLQAGSYYYIKGIDGADPKTTGLYQANEAGEIALPEWSTDIRFYDAQIHRPTYELYRELTFKTPDGTFGKLTRDADLKFELKLDGGQVFEFDERGRLTREIDRVGNRTEYAYDTNPDNADQSRLKSVTLQGGDQIEFRYAAPGGWSTAVTAIRVPGNRVVRLQGTEIFSPNPQDQGTDGSSSTISLKIGGRLMQAGIDEKAFEGVNEAEVKAFVYELGEEGKKAPSGAITGETPQEGFATYERETNEGETAGVWRFQFDRFGLLTAKAAPPAEGTGYTVWQWERDAATGLVTKAKAPEGRGAGLGEAIADKDGDANFDVTTIEYKKGAGGKKTAQVEKITYSDGTTESWTYGKFNQVLTHTDRNGNTWKYKLRDDDGEDGSVEYAYDPLGNYSYFTYTAKPGSVKDKVGGLVLTQESPTGESVGSRSKTEYDYDESGRVKSIKHGGIEEVFQYDRNGYLSAHKDADGVWHQYVNDRLGQLIEEYVGPDTGKILVAKYAYDAAGNRTSVSTPISSVGDDDKFRTTTFEYDAWNRLEIINHPAFKNAAGSDVFSYTMYEYTADGLVSHVWTTDNPVAGKMYRETVYEYDERRQLKKVYQSVDGLVDRTGAALAGVQLVKETKYDAEGNVKSEKNSLLNQETQFSYDENGRLVHMQQPATTENPALVTEYAYDGEGNVTKVTTPNPMGTDATRTVATTYKYDTAGRLERIEGPMRDFTGYTYYGDGSVKTETTGFGGATYSTTTHEYDALGRMKKTTIVAADAETMIAEIDYSADGNGRKEEHFDPRENEKTIYRYDAFGRLASVETPPPDGTLPPQTVTYAYNDDGSIESETLSAGSESRVKEYAYDARGRVYTVTAAGITTVYWYDEGDRLVETRGADGSVRSLAYDAFGNVVAARVLQGGDTLSETVSKYDVAGKLVEQTVDDFAKVKYEYDALNRERTREVDYLNDGEAPLHKVETSYNNAGLVRDTWNGLARTKIHYDNGGRVAATVVQTESGTHATRTDYDDAARKRTVTDPGGSATEFTTDGLGRIRIEKLVGVPGERTFAYDSSGNLTTTIDRNGRTISYQYDALNRRTKETWVGEGYEATYRYNELGDLEEASDGNSEYVYDYDPQGRFETIDFTNRAAPSALGGFQYAFTYDALNRPENTTIVPTAGGGLSVLTEYDALGRLVHLGGGGSIDVEFDYSAGPGSITSYRREAGTTRVTLEMYRTGQRTEYAYSGAGLSDFQIVKETNQFGQVTRNESHYNNVVYAETYQYDKLGQLTKATTTANNTTTTTFERQYDKGGNRAASPVDPSVTIDKHNRLTYLWVRNPSATAGSTTDGVGYEYQYDDEGNRELERRFDDHREYSDLDFIYRVSGFSNWKTAPVIGGTAHYTDESQSNTEWATARVFPQSANVVLDEGSTYRIFVSTPQPLVNGQPLARTTDALYTLSYDCNGETITHTFHLNQRAPGTYVIDGVAWREVFDVMLEAGTELETVSLKIENNDASTGVLVVDRIRIERLGNEVAYKYDHHNRLTEVRTYVAPTDPLDPGRLISLVEHAYDVFDRRIATTTKIAQPDGQGGFVNEVTHEYYVFNGDNRALTYRSTGSETPVLAERRFYAGVDQLLAVEKGGDVYWALTDEQGSLLGLYGQKPDNSYGLIQTFAYDPDGSHSADAERNQLFVDAEFAPQIDVSFQGRERDATTGLLDFRSRFYDPNSGIFISEDGIGIADDLNRYRFTRNSSTNFTDPSGHWVQIAVGGGIGAAIYLGTVAFAGVEFSWGGLFGAAVGGAVFAAIGPASFIGAIGAGGAAGAADGFTRSLVDQTLSGKGIDLSRLAGDTAWGAGIGAVAGPIGYGIGRAIGSAGRTLGQLGDDLLRPPPGAGGAFAVSYGRSGSAVGVARPTASLAEQLTWAKPMIGSGLRTGGKILSEASSRGGVAGTYSGVSMVLSMGATGGTDGPNSSGNAPSNVAPKGMHVGSAGHHVPAVRKSQGRPFEVDRSDLSRPTVHVIGDEQAIGQAHWRMHNAERPHIGPRQGAFNGTDAELFEAYRKSYKDLTDIRVDVRSPDGSHTLGQNVDLIQAVDLLEAFLMRSRR
jgi:RHS repeat-associated protein